LGGCLPLLIQLPFLFVLYRVLVNYDYGQAGFLWLPSLSQKDPYFILAVLMGLTTFLQQKMSMPTSGGEGNQQNLIMMVVMPIFLVFISWNLPSGVLLYWFVSNLFYIFQQYMVNIQVKKEKVVVLSSATATTLETKVVVEDKHPSPVSSPVPYKKGGKKHAKKR
ncbi:MAG: YidC/Oxa1 family membrane protein insertase, partial [Atribacterota bacterium]